MKDIKNFLDKDKKLIQLPVKRKMKLAVLCYLCEKFEKDRIYTEKEINEILNNWHTFSDPATLRRELYNFHFLDRANDLSSYSVSENPPQLDLD